MRPGFTSERVAHGCLDNSSHRLGLIFSLEKESLALRVSAWNSYVAKNRKPAHRASYGQVKLPMSYMMTRHISHRE